MDYATVLVYCRTTYVRTREINNENLGKESIFYIIIQSTYMDKEAHCFYFEAFTKRKLSLYLKLTFNAKGKVVSSGVYKRF